MAETVLIVDDDPVQRRILESTIHRFGYPTSCAEAGEPALEILEGPSGRDIALVILDLVMPDLDGTEVLRRMRKAGITTPVIVQTAHGGIETVVAAMRAGATDFFVKPVRPERLQVSMQNALRTDALENTVARMRRKVEGRLTFDDMVSQSSEMQRAMELGRRAAGSNIPVIIEGESGAGKEIVARAIQGSGPRAGQPFVAVNCGAIPENLIESTLFGHEKGAFTGATEKQVGKFVEADGGTLFLDEVSELPHAAQVKLLRALQEGEVDPVGARRPVKVDIRLISATNRSMIELVQSGRFREDLYYRLNVFPIMVPPLRHRREDIPILARHFVTRFAAEEKKRIERISPHAMALFQGCSWPGNVRQLENMIFRAVVLADGPVLDVAHFPHLLTTEPSADEDAPALDIAADPAHPIRPAMTGQEPGPAPMARLQGPSLSMLDESGDVRPLEEMEAELIRFALDHYRGRMTEVARRLGIGRSTLYRRLRELELEAAE